MKLSKKAETLKQDLWEVIDDHNSPLYSEIKDTMNLLLDLIDELEDED